MFETSGKEFSTVLSSESSSCNICKTVDQQESEKYDRENFIPCLKCNFIIPLDSLNDHFCIPKNKREELIKRSKFSLKTTKEFPSVIL